MITRRRDAEGGERFVVTINGKRLVFRTYAEAFNALHAPKIPVGLLLVGLGAVGIGWFFLGKKK